MDIIVAITREHTQSFPPHTHTVYEMMHYIEGNGVLATSSGDYEFSPGTVIVIPPGVRHGSVAKEYFRNICIHFPMTTPDLHEPFIMHDNREAGELIDLIFRLVVADKSKNQSCVRHLLKAAEDLVCLSFEAGADRFSSAAETVHREVMENFTKEDFDLAEVIASTHFSDDYFRVKYRERYGTTPYAYLLNLRIDYAADLLQEYGTHLMVAEIARQSGFSDPLYFSRLFKKKKGVSPKDYVKGTVH